MRASGLRDELAAHLESKTFYFPLDDVESEAGCSANVALKEELETKYLSKPHNRRCQFWSALSVKYPLEFRWDELVKQWNGSGDKAYVCRDLVQLRKIKEGLKGRSEGLEGSAGMLVPVRLQFVGRGRPRRFGAICLPTTEDLISIRRNRNLEIVQKPRKTVEVDPEELMDFEDAPKQPLTGFVSLDAAASEKPISLKWLFEETPRLDDKSVKRKRANRKKKDMRKKRKLEFETKKTEKEEEETQRETVGYRFSMDR